MDYEKKYKEALELARVAAFNGHQSLMEGIFPELKESEDEKIRKELIFYLGDMPEDTELRNGITNRDVLVWLEKQGGQKPQRMISAEAKEAMYDKPAWSEEDQNALEDVREAVVHYWGGDSQDILLYWLKSLKQRIKGE